MSQAQKLSQAELEARLAAVERERDEQRARAEAAEAAKSGPRPKQFCVVTPKGQISAMPHESFDSWPLTLDADQWHMLASYLPTVMQVIAAQKPGTLRTPAGRLAARIAKKAAAK